MGLGPGTQRVLARAPLRGRPQRLPGPLRLTGRRGGRRCRVGAGARERSCPRLPAAGPPLRSRTGARASEHVSLGPAEARHPRNCGEWRRPRCQGWAGKQTQRQVLADWQAH